MGNITRRDHYQAIAKQTGEMPKELTEKPIPEYSRYLWRWFCDLSSGRTYGASGANPLGWQDLQAWMTLTGRTLSAFELDLIKKIDIKYINSIHKDDA